MTRGMLLMCVVLFAFACGLSARAAAPVPPPATSATATDADTKEIDAFRAGLLDAFTRKDVDKLLTFVHPDVVVTWQNGEVSKGRDGVKAFYNRMIGGGDAVCDSITANPVVEGRTILGDTAISYGHMDDTFHLKDGTAFHLDSRFSAWLVREDGHWLLRGFHLSANVFDNDIQKLYVRKTATWTGIGAGVAGLIVGWIFARAFRGRAKVAA